MKSNWSHLDKYRTQLPPYISPPGATYGAFVIPYNGFHLRVIATDGNGGEQLKTEWEHVSCHAYDPHFKKQRCPNWGEMCYVASLFWEQDETVMQVRPPEADYVNIHEFVLHWWKPLGVTIPMPPKICV